jgi:hypothetical protein
MKSEFKYLAQKSTTWLSAKPDEYRLHPYTHISGDNFEDILISSTASHKPVFPADFKESQHERYVSQLLLTILTLLNPCSVVTPAVILKPTKCTVHCFYCLFHFTQACFDIGNVIFRECTKSFFFHLLAGVDVLSSFDIKLSKRGSSGSHVTILVCVIRQSCGIILVC